MRATLYVSAVALLGLVGCGPATTPNADNSGNRNSTSSSTSGHTGVAPVMPDNGVTGGSTTTGTNRSADGGRATGASATGAGTGKLSDATVGSDDGRADNTATNKRDRNDNAKTPINQNENQKDIDITAGIRKQIVNTEGMSTNARNVKIITADGKVTLRGPVASEDEKDKIEKFAKDVAGDGNIDNQLEVAP